MYVIYLSHYGAIEKYNPSHQIVHIKTARQQKTKAMDDPTHAYAMNALKRQKEERKRKTLAKDFWDTLIEAALSRLSEAKRENGGKLLPYGKMSEVIRGLSDHGVLVTRDVLNHKLKKHVKPSIEAPIEPARHPLAVIDVNVDIESNISSLHATEGAENAQNHETNVTKSSGGRPKGSTKANLMKEKKEKAFCIAEIAKLYDEKCNEARENGQRQVPRGYLKKTNPRKEKRIWNFRALLSC